MPYFLLRVFCFVFLLFPTVSWAYPQFIGYKYSSCLTCHFNGNGNGPLNDYGRALWAAEIAGRLWSSNNEEKLGEQSGFLGSTELPWYLRPGFKARQLAYMTNPGGPDSETRMITMQAEGNLAYLLDKQQKKMFLVSFGYAPVPFKYKGQPQAEDTDEWISREHYFRWQTSEDIWFYFGLFDKPYGIRHINHTAYSRSATSLAQNDQAHGVLVQFIKPNWEYSINAYVGNLFQEADLQQRGVSMTYEYEYKPSWRLGASLMSQANNYVQNQRVGVHSRYGFGWGSALMYEMGIMENTPKDFTKKRGYYIYSEAIQKLRRGYHWFMTGQAMKDNMVAGRANSLRFGTGLLIFPMQRYEFRIEAENNRQLSAYSEVPEESWALLTQLHISL